MTITTTGLFDLFLFFAIILFVRRFYQYWKEEKSYFSKLSLYFSIFFALWPFFTSIGGLFFVNNLSALKTFFLVGTFSQMIAFALFGALLVYLKVPKISPKLAFLIIFLLGSISLGLYASSPFFPFLEESGSINWNEDLLGGILRFLIFIATLLPLGVILIKQGLISEDRQIRIRSFVMGSLFLLGLFFAPFDFFLNRLLRLGSLGSDIVILILVAFLFLVIFLTRKSKK